MKKIFILASVAVLASACAPDIPTAAAPKPTTTTTGSTSTSTTGTTPPATTGTTTTGSTTATTTGSTTASTSTTRKATTTTTGSTSSALQPGDIKIRLHQLRELERTKVTAGGHTIDAFVADDHLKEEEGLMWVTNADLKDDQGMLFVMENPGSQNFWMRNTLIPLDIIYIGADMRVVNIVHGKPKDETNLPSTGPAKYVLELKDGMASKLGIGPKTKLGISSSLAFKSDAPPNNGMNFAPQ